MSPEPTSPELDRLAAACLSPSFPGLDPPDWVRRWLSRGLGGITLFAYNVGDPARVGLLTASLRAERPDVVLSIDEEGGDVTRLEVSTGSSSPGNLALGAVDDVELTRAVATSIGARLLAAGIDLDLAPVADVNTNPRNPVIGVRSFGSDPALVSRHVAAFVEGLQRTGVAACAKHFPGHGDTELDSHLDLPVVGGDLDSALEPFRAAIAAEVAAVMAGHLLVPALDDVPATLSPFLLTDLLRGELGFDGTVVTDALEMRAIAAGVGIADGAVRALAAGADLLCLGHDLHEQAVETIHAAICAAVDSGRLCFERLAEAAERVERLARRERPVFSGDANGTPGAEAARRALRVVGEARLAGAPIVVELAAADNIAAGPHRHGLADLLPGSRTVRLRSARLPDELLAAHAAHPIVVVQRDAVRHEWQRAAVAALVELRPDAVVVETGLPGWLPEGAEATIETLGAGGASLRAAADLLRRWSVSGSNR